MRHSRNGECHPDRRASPMRLRRAGTAALLTLLTAGTFAGCAPEPEQPTTAQQTREPAAEQPTQPTEPTAAQTAAEGPAQTPAGPPAAPAFDRTQHSIDDPMSIWIVGNKRRPLDPADFEPSDLVPTEGVANDNGQPLREVAARAVERFIGGAREAGYDVRIISAYRTHALQVQLYDGYVVRDGQVAADTYSARPGHSEHQTGLTVDLDDYGACYLASCFGDTAAGQWLAANAAEYGFIERYPAQKQHVTGFMPEPWHFRFVGPKLAAQMRDTGVTTLEEFFDLPAAPDYAS